MTSVAKLVCSPPRVWGRVAADLDDEEVVAVGLHQPLRRVRLCQRGGPYFTRGVGVMWCADVGLYQSMRRVVDLDEEAAAGLHQPTPRVTGPTCIHVCADTLLDEDSASDVAPIELEVSSDEEILVLPFVVRVTWAVPECEIICIACVGKGKCVPVKKRETGPMPRRGSLSYVRPPSDSEDEDSDEEESVPWADPFVEVEQPFYNNREACESSRE